MPCRVPTASESTAACGGRPTGTPAQPPPTVAASSGTGGSGPEFAPGVPTCDGRRAASRARFRPRRRATRAGAARFFYRRPALPDPLPNRPLVPFARPARRPRQRPVQPAQEVPDVARVIADTRHPLDDRRHAGQRPEVGAEAVSVGTTAQGRVDLGELPGVQSRLPARAPGRL